MESYVREAVHIAQKSNHVHNWHGCVIVNKDDGSIVSAGYNHNLQKPLKTTYSIHAEMHALSKFGPSLQTKYPNCFMVVVRVGRMGDIKFSMPCATCRRLIEQRPCIRRVYYS